MTTRVGAVGVEETTGAGVLLRSGGRLEAFPMPLGSDRTLGLAGPYGTPLIAELPAPADPAGGVSCAKACPGRYKLPSTARTSAVMRDIWPSGNNKVSRGFPQARPSTSPCVVRLVKTGNTHSEQMFSAFPSIADIVSRSRLLLKIPADTPSRTCRKASSVRGPRSMMRRNSHTFPAVTATDDHDCRGRPTVLKIAFSLIGLKGSAAAEALSAHAGSVVSQWPQDR